jgi:hypothetical protein
VEVYEAQHFGLVNFHVGLSGASETSIWDLQVAANRKATVSTSKIYGTLRVTLQLATFQSQWPETIRS